MNFNCRAREFWISSALILAPLLALCVRFVDIPVALFVKTRLYRSSHWSRLTSDLPDLLLLAVVLVTCIAFSLYMIRSKKGIFDPLTSLAKVLSWSAPVAYLMKGTLKFVFGRNNTRDWVSDPELYGFHFFQGGHGLESFPSGHMLVVATILAAVCRFYPRSRKFCVMVALLLAAALVATNYHFVSDVVAGAYVGMLIEAVLFHLLLEEPRGLGFPAI